MRASKFIFIGVCMAFFAACDKPSTTAECPAACLNDSLQHTQKVLLIGIDGCRPDALTQASTPNIDQLMQDGRYSLNVDRGGLHTSSGPGWSTMLTGVWPNKHGVIDNSYEGHNYAEYPPFYSRLKAQSSCFQLASMVHYKDINDVIAASSPLDVLLDYNSDALVAEAAANYINDCNLDVLFMHFDQVDHAGHSNGFHPDVPQYIQAIEQVDVLLGPVLEAVYQRELNNNEDWLIVISSDHGGKIDGTHASHDNDSEVTQVFAVFRDKNTTEKGLMPYNPTLVDIVPTILNHLDVAVDSLWQLDGQRVVM